MFSQQEQLPNKHFLSTLRNFPAFSSSNPEINSLLNSLEELQTIEKKVDKCLSKKRTEIQEYLTFCPQNISTNLRIYIKSSWKNEEGGAKQLIISIFGQFLLNDNEEQLKDLDFEGDNHIKNLLRVQNFVDLVRELRVDFINTVANFI